MYIEGVRPSRNRLMQSDVTLTAWNGIDPRWGAVNPFDVTEVDVYGLAQARGAIPLKCSWFT